MKNSLPREIRKSNGGLKIKIIWDDGTVKEWSAQTLREACHCAACHHELTGENLIPSGSVSSDIHILKTQLVGNYAISFLFSDGHSVGIYPFDSLKQL